MQRFLMGIKDAEDDDGAVWFDGKVDGIREGVDGLYSYVIVTDGRSGGQAADLFKIDVKGVGELKSQAVGAAVIVLECAIDIVDGIGRQDNGMGH